VTRALEDFLFQRRGLVLAVLALFTAVMAGYASQIRLETAFEKHLPIGHPYIDTFLEYKEELVGVNQVVLALRAKDGDIWNVDYFRRLSQATDALFFMPGIDRRTVTSFWTPNIRTIEITEDGMRAEDMIGGDVTVDTLTQEEVERIRGRVIRSGLVGRVVSNDFTTAMVIGEALDVGVGSEQGGVLDLADRLEAVRAELSDERFDVHLLGFVTMTGFIGRGAKTVVVFFLIALVLTAAAVYAYSRSWILTLLPLLCSLISGVWQFGVMALLGYGLDPLAILVPFLVFAIGVSHGIQQINLIATRVIAGDDKITAARTAFRGLLVPGTMALLTDLVAFVTLVLIPIPMVQDLGVTAAIGVAFKIVSNLILLPLLASFFDFDGKLAARTESSRALATKVMRFVGRLAEPKHATRTLAAFVVIFGVAVWQGEGRHIGDLHPGATELRPDSRYNADANLIVSKFDIGLDVLIVVAEAGDQSCIDFETLDYIDRFTWHMVNVPGVLSGMSISVIAKVINSAWNEGNLAWRSLPRNRYSLVQATSSIPSGLGVVNADCTIMPIHVYTADHKADTLARVVGAAARFRDDNPSEKVNLRLASGNVGIQAATNASLDGAEVPMMLYAYASIVILVIITYRSWRAVICCCLPLTTATFLGYWFMKELEIGVKVSTLPVMVLAVGIGVDYAFYIYSRIQVHLDQGKDIVVAYQQALFETGNAVVFTAITLAIGVATWSFSPLKFQADMGMLLAFMFMINMVMTATVLPALAVTLDWLIPRRPTRRIAGDD
jgi:predicted RND superfamily exporter protein